MRSRKKSVAIQYATLLLLLSVSCLSTIDSNAKHSGSSARSTNFSYRVLHILASSPGRSLTGNICNTIFELGALTLGNVQIGSSGLPFLNRTVLLQIKDIVFCVIVSDCTSGSSRISRTDIGLICRGLCFAKLGGKDRDRDGDEDGDDRDDDSLIEELIAAFSRLQSSCWSLFVA